MNENNNRLKEIITEYLKNASYIQIATASENKPWICTVHFAYDGKLNFYWISHPSTRHSSEIRNNQRVAAAIFNGKIINEKVQGIQLSGTAKELQNENDIRNGLEIYQKRFGISQDRIEEIISNVDEHCCYQIVPEVIVLFDQINFPESPRQEFKL